MSVQNATVLKSYYETGDKPTQQQFGDLVDSLQEARDNAVTALATAVSAQTVATTALSSVNNRVLRAGDTMTGQLVVDGSADTEQLVLIGHSSQTDPILLIQNNALATLLSFSNLGDFLILRHADIGGDLDVGGDGDITGNLDVGGDLDVTGTFTAGSFSTGGDLGVAGSLILGTAPQTSRLTSASSGVITLQDNATTSFNRLQFGGTTSSFPAIKRNGVNLEARLADDSALTGLSVTTLTATAVASATLGLTRGSLTANAPSISDTETWNNVAVTFQSWLIDVTNTASAAGSRIIEARVGGTAMFSVSPFGVIAFGTVGTSSSRLVSPASGVVTLTNDDGTDFGRLQFGGTTSAFPSLKRSGATLEVRLADDSAGAILLASAVQATAGVTNSLGTITTNVIPYYADATWNNVATVFHGMRMDITDTASHATSRLLLFTVGGISRFTVNKSGALAIAQTELTAASQPVIDMAASWNNAGITFTGVKFDVTGTALATGSLLVDLGKDAISRFTITHRGTTTLHRQEADINGSTLQLSKRGTTGDATAAIANASSIVGIDAMAWDGTSQATVANIRLFALENFTNTAHGDRWILATCAIGSTTASTRLQIDAVGVAIINGPQLSVARGTITTNVPTFDTSETWNAGGVTFQGWRMDVTNTASAAASRLLELRVGGAAQFTVDVAGNTTAGFVLAGFKDTSTNTAPVALEAYHDTTSGTPTTSNGVSFDLRMDSSTTDRQIGSRLTSEWTDATHATRTSRLRFFVINSAATFEALTIDPVNTSFINGSTPLITQGTITADLKNLAGTVTWNNAAVVFVGWQLSVTVTAANGGSRYISILKNGADHAILDDLSRWHVFRATADNTGGNMTLFKRGTTGDATAVVAADAAMGFYSVRGWNGTAYHSDGTGVFMFADELFSGTAGGTRIEMRTVAPTTISNGAYAVFKSSSLTLQSGCRHVVTRGTLTANAPSIDITETWNAAVTFTCIKANVTNTSSNGGSLLMDLQVGAIQRFYAMRTGTIGLSRREADDQGVTIDMIKRGTTGDANGAIASGAVIAAIDVTGYDGTGSNTVATFRCLATEAHTNTAHGTRWQMSCPANGATTNSVRFSLSAASLDLTNSCAYFLNGAALLNPLATYAAGTVYTLTNASAALDFGTTDPILTINAIGTYQLRGRVKVALNGATFAANQTLTVKLRRTNNTATDVTNSTTTFIVPIVTTQTNTLAIINLPEVAYTTANTNDTITIFADIGTLPSAGTITIDEASIVALRTS